MASNEQSDTPAAGIPEAPVPAPDAGGPSSSHRNFRWGHWVGILLPLAAALGIAAYFLRPPLGAIRIPAAQTGEPSSSEAPAPNAARERKILYWEDPMHPWYRSDKPGKAPDCGMDLVPVYEEARASEGALPEGAFKLMPEKQQLIGVQYGEAISRPLVKTIRAVGQLAYDETRIIHIHSKIDGWIEQVFVDFTGAQVEKDQPLLSIYSPDLVATQEEYLLALKARDQLGNSPFKDVAAGAESLLEAARRRLELWDMTAEQIAELEKTRKPAKAVTLYSSNKGFVLARNAYKNQRITSETDLYTIADLSDIWVVAEVYEYEASLIKLGQSARMNLTSFPGRTYWGKVSYIYPQFDNATRTLRVRLEFPNPAYALKPDMYANVELRIDFGKHLSVPKDAVLDSGTEQTVFVALKDGYFEPRKVTLGQSVDDRVIVLDGVKEGERIVTSGNFLIDSESRLKAAEGTMGMPGTSMPGMQHGTGGSEKLPAKREAPAPKAKPMDHSQHQKKNS